MLFRSDPQDPPVTGTNEAPIEVEKEAEKTITLSPEKEKEKVAFEHGGLSPVGNKTGDLSAMEVSGISNVSAVYNPKDQNRLNRMKELGMVVDANGDVQDSDQSKESLNHE